jgi:hypothetical protein
MKYAYTIILVALIITAGCSSEENTDPPEIKTSVRQAIKLPASSNSGKPDSPAAAEELSKTKPGDIKNRSRIPDADIKQVKPEKKEGQYIVREGDSLPGIANKKDIYNSHLKWTILYRDNRKVLAGYKAKKDFPDTRLSSGMILKFITDYDFKKNLQGRSINLYVVNILSSPDMEKIISHTVKLIDNNYFTYITGVKVNEKNWYRLRVGFFPTRADAREAGQKIKELLGIPEIWAAEIEDDEFREFGGY